MKFETQMNQRKKIGLEKIINSSYSNTTGIIILEYIEPMFEDCV
jgi:hypothetical protein